MVDALPQTFGRYILRERVGQGGMAEVFRASLPGFGGFDKVVAIKRMFREYAADAQFVEMLTDEAKIVSHLAHPNIVQILDVGQIQGDYYIAFEYVEGVDLFRLLQRHHELQRDMPVALAAFAIAELCSALDYAHARRTNEGTPLAIVHRDVSPQNVLVSLVGEVKLTDFGIAKAAYRYTHTQAGLVKGKVYYMSPEQVLGQPVDHRSDLFAAGILLFEALVTRPLYDEVDQQKLYEKVAAGRYVWPADKASRVPPALRAVVDQALRSDPGARFQSGRAMRDAILRAMRESAVDGDREELGRYLRSMYHVDEGLPVSVVVAAPRLQPPGETEARWHSSVARVPQDDSPAETTMHKVSAAQIAAGASQIAGPTTRRPEPLRTGRVPLPQPGAMVRTLDPDAPPALTRSATTPPPPVPPQAPALRPLPGRPTPAPNVAAPAPRPMPAVRPLPTGAPSSPRPPPPGGTPAPRPAPVPMPVAVRPVAVPMAAPIGLPQPAVPRPRPPGPAAPLPEPPRKPTLDPRRATGPAPMADDESTSMLDQAEMARRLAEARGVAVPAPPEVPPDAHEASTRFVDSVPEDIDDTTRPQRRRLAGATLAEPLPVRPVLTMAAPQAVQMQMQMQMPPPAPVSEPALDLDDMPASWGLLALAALVWTGVLVTGLYATLLTVR